MKKTFLLSIPDHHSCKTVMMTLAIIDPFPRLVLICTSNYYENYVSKDTNNSHFELPHLRERSLFTKQINQLLRWPNGKIKLSKMIGTYQAGVLAKLYNTWRF